MKFERRDEGSVIALRIEGELDALSAPEVRPSLDAVIAAAPKRVTLDLASLRMIDSSGVGAIVSLYKRLRAAGGELEISGVSGQPLAIFKVLRLDRVFGTA